MMVTEVCCRRPGCCAEAPVALHPTVFIQRPPAHRPHVPHTPAAGLAAFAPINVTQGSCPWPVRYQPRCRAVFSHCIRPTHRAEGIPRSAQPRHGSPAPGPRADQARRTRKQIVDAAGRLFVDRGYSGTTVDAIATEAGVSRKTVFTSVGGKVALLKLAYDFTLAGDDAPVPLIDRPALQAVIAEPDPYRQVDLYAAAVTEKSRRVARPHLVLRSAADVDE